MRPNNYLEEERRSRSVSVTAKWVKDFISHNDNSVESSSLYRGIKGATEPYYFTDPSKGERGSQDTFIFYVLMMDNFPEWKEYPKRSKSIIMGTSDDVAYSYGTAIYRVFPVNNAKIAISPKFDVWSAFVFSLGSGIETFSIELNTIFGLFREEIHKEQKITYEELLKKFSIADRPRNKERIKTYYQEMSLGLMRSKIFHDKSEYINTPKLKLVDVLREKISPKNNNFELITLNKHMILPPRREAWTDSECVLVSVNSLKNILDPSLL